ncbi:MAG: hypothetical protein RIR55_854 [Bacteroidota bacterium]|jgi:hypothetical protein
MKKLFLVASFICITAMLNAQSLIGGDHILKTNLSADALQNYNLTFEKSLNHFMSLSVSYATMPKRNLPLKDLAKQFIDNPNINFDNFKVANNAITVESRFYLGIQKMSGFYIAPYARFGNMEVEVPVNYKYTYTPAPVQGVSLPAQTISTSASLTGTIRSQSIGAYFGMQYQLLTKLVLDFWVIGGHYGTSNGRLQADLPAGTPSIIATPALNALKSTIDQTNANPFHLNTIVSGNSIITNTDGPWAGLRGAGITIGLRF